MGVVIAKRRQWRIKKIARAIETTCVIGLNIVEIPKGTGQTEFCAKIALEYVLDAIIEDACEKKKGERRLDARPCIALTEFIR